MIRLCPFVRWSVGLYVTQQACIEAIDPMLLLSPCHSHSNSGIDHVTHKRHRAAWTWKSALVSVEWHYQMAFFVRWHFQGVSHQPEIPMLASTWVTRESKPADTSPLTRKAA